MLDAIYANRTLPLRLRRCPHNQPRANNEVRRLKPRPPAGNGQSSHCSKAQNIRPVLLCSHDTKANSDRYLSLDVWPVRQARNAAAACSRSSALLTLRRGCFGGWLATGVAPLTSSTPCRRIRLRFAIRVEFTRPAITHFSKAAGGSYGAKARRLCLSTPNDADLCRKKRSCGATRGSLFDHLVGR